MSSHRNPAHGGSRPPFVAALLITLAYAVLEFAGGIWSGSLALVSDAGHMLSDALALGLAAAAARLARRPAGVRHSYGWARAEVIGAMLNCLIMLGIVVMLAVESFQRLLAPQPVAAGGVMLIAFCGLVVNAVVAFMLGGSHGVNARAALLHVMGDLLSSVAALVAGAVIFMTGWYTVDPLLSLVIAGLILISTLRLLRDTVHVLMEGVPPAIDLNVIGKALAALDGVHSVHDLHVWSIAPEQVALSAHLEIADLGEWPRILREARTLMHDRFGIGHVTLQPEPSADGGAPAVVRIWPARKASR